MMGNSEHSIKNKWVCEGGGGERSKFPIDFRDAHCTQMCAMRIILWYCTIELYKNALKLLKKKKNSFDGSRKFF